MCRIMTELPIEIRRSRRARRLSARVHLDGHVEVVVPMYAPGVIVDDFVARHRTWMDARTVSTGATGPSRTRGKLVCHSNDFGFDSIVLF